MNLREIKFVHLTLVFTLSLTFWSSTECAKKHECSTCKEIVENFHKGLEKTAKSNFGGGNTNWEETRLSSYATSETRLIEIADDLCSDSAKECHTLVEEYEETLEKWWFKVFANKGPYGLFEYFCVNKVAACCPNGTWGPTCTECPGGKDKYCHGNGKCVGEGTRTGTGGCDCNDGYRGDQCQDCKDGYYEDERNDTHTTCIACDTSCQSTCWEGGPKGCDDCKAGWNMVDEQGCRDINECDAESTPCGENEFCENSLGSYKCYACDASCVGCTRDGPMDCKECADRFFDSEGVCTKCHESCANSCTGPEPTQCDSCRKGWLLMPELGCQDENECETQAPACGNGKYCINKEGSFQCLRCDGSCSECSGPGADKCLECKTGFQRDGDKCVDLDECSAEMSPCTKEHESCMNTPGSFKCNCKDGFVRVGDKCEEKKRSPPGSGNSKSTSSKPSSSKNSKAKSVKPKGSKDKSTKKKGKAKDSQYDLLKYFSSLIGYAIVGNLLRKSAVAQTVFTTTFWIYLYWFTMRWDKLTKKA